MRGYDQQTDSFWRRFPPNFKEPTDEGFSIRRRDIPELLKNPDFVEAVNLWVDYKQFGNPYAEGWMDWPTQAYDIIKCFDRLYVEYKPND